jgi:dihydroorotate dehydrogenase (fumarate)
MTTSSLLRHGPDHIRVLEDDLVAWMAEHGFDSVDQLRGSMSVAAVASPSAFERANYVRTLHSWGTPASTPVR